MNIFLPRSNPDPAILDGSQAPTLAIGTAGVSTGLQMHGHERIVP